MLRGVAAQAQRFGRKPAAIADHKEGDVYLRKLLVQGAPYILEQHGPDTDLKRRGLKLSSRGGKNAKKRAIVVSSSPSPKIVAPTANGSLCL